MPGSAINTNKWSVILASVSGTVSERQRGRRQARIPAKCCFSCQRQTSSDGGGQLTSLNAGALTGSLNAGSLTGPCPQSMVEHLPCSMPTPSRAKSHSPTGGTNATTASGALNNLLPNQTSQGGKFLQTDGANASWSIRLMPSQAPCGRSRQATGLVAARSRAPEQSMSMSARSRARLCNSGPAGKLHGGGWQLVDRSERRGSDRIAQCGSLTGTLPAINGGSLTVLNAEQLRAVSMRVA